MKFWMMVILPTMTLALGGCATKNVPESRQQQVEEITQTGPYSYERAVDGPPR